MINHITERCTIRKVLAFLAALLAMEMSMIMETNGLLLGSTRKCCAFQNRSKAYYYDKSFTSLASSVDLKSNSDDSRIPKLNRDSKDLLIKQSISFGSIQQGGYFCSFEIYACQRETQKLVGSHLANWARAEIYCLKESGTFSMILNSVCGRRVVHVVGWKVEGNALARSFEDMRKRGEGTCPLQLRNCMIIILS